MSEDDRELEPTRRGRPRKNDLPRIDYNELDRLLVFGEIVPTDDKTGSTVFYPSNRELARRFGVAHSLITRYSRQHNCIARRKEAQARVHIKADQKLIERRATAIAFKKEDELRIIDSYLEGFQTAMAEGRVRFDSVADFNTLVRLKEFIQGGPDSRQEIQGQVTLEALQERHDRMMRTLDEAPDMSENQDVIEKTTLAEKNTDTDAIDVLEVEHDVPSYELPAPVES